MPTSVYNLASQVVGTRERGFDAWRDQIQRNARQRVSRDTPFAKVLLDALKAQEIKVTNPHHLPPSEPILRPTNESIGAGVLMPPIHRNIVMARALLATEANARMYFGR